MKKRKKQVILYQMENEGENKFRFTNEGENYSRYKEKNTKYIM